MNAIEKAFNYIKDNKDNIKDIIAKKIMTDYRIWELELKNKLDKEEKEYNIMLSTRENTYNWTETNLFSAIINQRSHINNLKQQLEEGKTLFNNLLKDTDENISN